MVQSPEPDRAEHNGAEASRGKSTRKVLNVRLLMGTLIIAAVFTPAAYAWRSYQVHRAADAFLARADALEQEKKWEEAGGYLSKYLRLRPQDERAAELRVRLAQAADRSAHDLRRKSRAVELYYQALGALESLDAAEAAGGSQPAIRVRIAELLLELQRYASAEKEARTILARSQDDPHGTRLLALALYARARSGGLAAGSSDITSVDEVFKRALDLNPGHIELSTKLAWIYREEEQLWSKEVQGLKADDRQRLADNIMDEMVAASPRDPQTYLARYQYRTRYRLPGAQEDLDAALKYGPEDWTVLMTAARHALEEAGGLRGSDVPGASVPGADVPGASVPENTPRSLDSNKEAAGRRAGLYAKACEFYERAIKAAPASTPAYLELGNAYLDQGKADLAVEAWQRGVDRPDEPGDPLGSRFAETELNARLAATLMALKRLDEAEKQLDAIERAVREIGPRLIRSYRLSLERTHDLLRGQWHVAKGEYDRAIPLLRRATTGQASLESEVRQTYAAWLTLGGVYDVLGQWDQAALAYEQAAGLALKDPAPRLLAARAWQNAGRPEMAVRYYEEASALTDAPGVWLALAGARFQAQLALPKKERDWSPFEHALNRAKTKKAALPEPWRTSLLEAGYLALGGKEGKPRKEAFADALKLLRETESEYPKSADLLQALVPAYEKLGSSPDADRALEQFGQLAADTSAPCILRSRLYSQRKQYEQARQALQDGLKTLAPGQHTAIQMALVQLSLDEGRLEEAQQRLVRIHEQQPTNTAIVRQLAELAFERKDLKEAERWEMKLRELEGAAGHWWRYCRARRLAAQATGPDDSRLVEAAELQAAIQSERPSWAPAHVLGAVVFERRGRTDEAIGAYKQAVHFGESRISVYERLIALLYLTRRLEEAQQYLEQLQDRVPLSQSLSSLELSVATTLGETDRALVAARRGVEARPKDPMARIWLGQMLLLKGETAEAEEAYKEAVRLAPTDAQTYNALFTFYLRNNQAAPARSTLEELVQKTELTEAQRAFVLAQGYELLGDAEKAEASYREAQRLAPESAAVQRRFAAFLLKRDPAAAEEALRGLLKLKPQDSDARRVLAALLASRGGDAAWAEVQQLLERPGARQDVSSLDRRLQAVLLAQRGGAENLRKARRLCERLVSEAKSTVPGDRLLLARLCEAEGDIDAARQQFTSLVGQAGADPIHLAMYIDLLLRHDLLDEAAPRLTRLEQLAPNSPSTVGLRARWLRAKKREPEIKPLVDQLADHLLKQAEGNQQKLANAYLSVGNLYSSVEQHQEAESWYRRLAEAAPEKFQPLMLSLVRQGRMDEAVAVCRKAEESDKSARPAAALASALASAQLDAEKLRLAEPFLSAAAERHPDDADLLESLANVRVVEGRTDDAIRLYQQVLKLKPDNVVALNNLATLLSEKPDRRSEGLSCIEQAITQAGPRPALLDTKATILLYDDKPQEAVELLETAVASLAADPRFHLHLAVAYDRVGDAGKARDALRRARDERVSDQILTQTERQMLAELEQKLGQ